MKVGYARVSTIDQNPQLQVDALLAAGCAKLFTDKASGADRDRPELARALRFLRPGDVLVCWKFDRLARSLSHLLMIIDDLIKRDIHFACTAENIDTSTPMGKLQMHLMGAFAEFERAQIKERTVAGLAAAKRRGKKLGGKRKLDRAAIAEMIAKRGIGIRVHEICTAYKISKATFYRNVTYAHGASVASN
jgi:DNA invertase Pin-like site-specific DNA recombinase